MRLISPTAFKGTLTPLEAARSMAQPGDRLLPLSDGGDGFLESLHHTLGGEFREYEAADPFGHIRPVPILILPTGVVAVECAKVIGLAGLDHLDPIRASSGGLGRLLSELSEASEIWLGLGGSATVDGGRDWPAFSLPPTTVFCDVQTDLADAVRIFGPQKGAQPKDIPLLHARLMALALPRGPRTGAAGGLGAKLLSMGATLVDGADAILNAVDFEDRCAGCDSVITGEGRLDASTLEGKLPAVVAQRARALGLRVIGRFGCKGEGWEAAAGLFDEVAFLVP